VALEKIHSRRLDQCEGEGGLSWGEENQILQRGITKDGLSVRTNKN
jgi:hypothetical protein